MPTLPEEANFAKFLLNVGDGVLNDDDNNFIIPHSCLAIADSDTVDYIYGNLIREKRYEELANSAILSARSLDVEDNVDSINRAIDSYIRTRGTSVLMSSFFLELFFSSI